MRPITMRSDVLLPGLVLFSALGLEPQDKPHSPGLLIAATIVAVWLVLAVWALVRSVRDTRDKKSAEAWGRRLHALLQSAPHAYLIAEPNGRVFSSDLLRRWLALPGAISALEDLAPETGDRGFAGPDFDALMADIAGVRAAGQPFVRTLNTEDGKHVIVAHGRSLSPIALNRDPAALHAVAIWFLDTTDFELRISHLESDRDALINDLDIATFLIEMAPFPIWQRDKTLQLEHVNAAYVRAVDAKDPMDVVERQLELMPDVGAAHAERARSLGEIQIHEEPVIVEGDRRSMRVYDVPLIKDTVAGFGFDITDSDALRSELQRFSRAQSDMLNSLSTPVVIFSADRRMTFCNSAFERVFGLDPAWLADRPSHDELLDHLRSLHRIPEQSDFRAWKQKQLKCYSEIFDRLEDMWHLPDERTLRIVMQSHPMGGVQMIIEDVTKQLTLERSVSTLSKVQTVTLNNLHEGVALFSQGGQVRLSNKAFADLLGANRDWLDTQPFIEEAIRRAGQLDEQAQVTLRSLVRTVASDRAPVQGELVLLNDRIVTLSGVPLPDGSSLLTLIDVTDSRVRQRALEQSHAELARFNGMRSRFIANTSYELRTPLTSIIGFAEMLEKGYAGALDGRQREYLIDIIKSSQKLDALIGDLLDLTILGSGSFNLEKKPASIIGILDNVARDQKAAAQAKSITMVLDVAELRRSTVDVLHIDPSRMRQAVTKVLENAIQYTPKGGRVLIMARTNKKSVFIYIFDNGPGISKEDQAVIFEAFQQGSGGRAGIGLGLSLVRHIMEAHKGRVSILSELGKGTRISLEIPIADPSTGEISSDDAAPPLSA